MVKLEEFHFGTTDQQILNLTHLLFIFFWPGFYLPPISRSGEGTLSLGEVF